MAQTLGQVTPGALVKLNENGSPVEFYAAKGNYESGLNSNYNHVLLVRRYTSTSKQFNSNVNAYANGGLDTWLNNEYKSTLDEWVQTRISLGGGTRFYYTPGNGNNTVTRLQRAVFTLSMTELGKSGANSEGAYLSIASTLLAATDLNGTPGNQWTRSPDISGSTNAWYIRRSDGAPVNAGCTNHIPARPCFTLPYSLWVMNDGTVVESAPTPSSISVPPRVGEGSPISISWGAATDATGYILQRRADGGAWTQAYTGTALTYTDTAGSWTTVQYRVCGVFGTANSDYVTSSVVTVLLAPSSITVPATAMTGRPVPVSWGAAEGADSYILQRSADSGAWEQVYAGTALAYTDTAGSWTTVQYQVQGVFSGAGGPFAQSGLVSIIPASALVISGQDGNLGVITSDIGYSVTSDTGNPISLTRRVNGQTVASVGVESGAAYAIPVMDLPTGTGAVQLEATVQAASSPVTVTRTWTYTKAPVAFPDAGSVAQLTQDGGNVFPVTLAEAVRVPAGQWGDNLGTALDQIAKGVSKSEIARFTSSTTWTPDKDMLIDIYISGGGGGGGAGVSTNSHGAGGGGGGGYCKLVRDVAVKADTLYTIIIGAGGTAGTTSARAGTGGASSFGDIVSANGGSYGDGYGMGNSNSGGSGGCGGGSGASSSGGIGGLGGFGGSDGWMGNGTTSSGGTGSRKSTEYTPVNPYDGKFYGCGGGGGGSSSNGAGGGGSGIGSGGNGGTGGSRIGVDGSIGGGGGGGGWIGYQGGAGGSGICIIYAYA